MRGAFLARVVLKNRPRCRFSGRRCRGKRRRWRFFWHRRHFSEWDLSRLGLQQALFASLLALFAPSLAPFLSCAPEKAASLLIAAPALALPRDPAPARPAGARPVLNSPPPRFEAKTPTTFGYAKCRLFHWRLSLAYDYARTRGCDGGANVRPNTPRPCAGPASGASPHRSGQCRGRPVLPAEERNDRPAMSTCQTSFIG